MEVLITKGRPKLITTSLMSRIKFTSAFRPALRNKCAESVLKETFGSHWNGLEGGGCPKIAARLRSVSRRRDGPCGGIGMSIVWVTLNHTPNHIHLTFKCLVTYVVIGGMYITLEIGQVGVVFVTFRFALKTTTIF